MRRLATFTLTTCFAAVWSLFSAGSLLLAQEEKGDIEMNVLRQEQVERFVERVGKIKDATLARNAVGMRVMELDPHALSPGYPHSQQRKRGIELRKEELEKTLRSHGDAGLVTLLRFEKARVCRKAGMYDEAIEELQKIIERNLADETTIAARWTLAEILQEQKENEQAIVELERIFISASDIQDRMDAMYGILTLSGEGPKARIRTIERLIQALVTSQANWDKCMKNLEQLYAAERKYAEDHGGHLSEKLSELYPDYVGNLDVFTCPASDDPQITRKQDIDSLTSYILVAKGKPVEGVENEAESPFPDGGRSRDKIWIREKEQNHGRRWFTVSSNGAVGWFAR